MIAHIAADMQRVRGEREHARNGNGRVHAGLGTRHPCRVTPGLSSRSPLPLSMDIAACFDLGSGDPSGPPIDPPGPPIDPPGPPIDPPARRAKAATAALQVATTDTILFLSAGGAGQQRALSGLVVGAVNQAGIVSMLLRQRVIAQNLMLRAVRLVRMQAARW